MTPSTMSELLTSDFVHLFLSLTVNDNWHNIGHVSTNFVMTIDDN